MAKSKEDMTPDEMFEEIRKIESLGHYDVILSSNGCQIWDRRFRGKATGLVIDADFCHTLEENANHGLKDAYKYLVEHDKKIIEEENKMNYLKVVPEHAILMTVEKFQTECVMGRIAFDDGHGHPVRGNDMDDSVEVIVEHNWAKVPRSATHVAWFKKQSNGE